MSAIDLACENRRNIREMRWARCRKPVVLWPRENLLGVRVHSGEIVTRFLHFAGAQRAVTISEIDGSDRDGRARRRDTQ